MEINVLSHTSALTPGSELWIVPDSDQSVWSRRIDWYLNFQIARALNFEQKKPSQELIALTTHFEIPMPTLKLNKFAPTIIDSSGFLPNRNIVVLPFTGESKDWIENCFEIWTKLQHPTLRIFCPIQIKQEQIRGKWERISGKAMTLVFEATDKTSH